MSSADEAMSILAKKIKSERLWEVLHRSWNESDITLIEALESIPDEVLERIESVFDWSTTA